MFEILRVLLLVLYAIGATFGFYGMVEFLGQSTLWAAIGFGGILLNSFLALWLVNLNWGR